MFNSKLFVLLAAAYASAAPQPSATITTDITISSPVVSRSSTTSSALPENTNALTIHPNGNNAKCLGIVGGILADGSGVDIYDCNDTPTQKWFLANGKIMSVGSNFCVDAGAAGFSDGTPLKIWTCYDNLAQQTFVQSQSELKLYNTQYCVDLTNGDLTNKNILQLWTCTAGNTNQIWTPEESSVTSVLPTTSTSSSSPQNTNTVNVHPNGNNAKCLGVVGGVLADGTLLDIYDCNGSAAQRWFINGGRLTIANSGYCVDGGADAFANGTPLKIWTCYDNLSQQEWVQQGSTFRDEGYCLDLTNGVTTNRNGVQMWECVTGDTNQVWTWTQA